MKNPNPDPYHRRHSLRLEGYDYSRSGLYYLTICTHDKQCLFGEIDENGLKLNEAGEFATQCWNDIPKHFPHVILHEFIVMPNHIHGIIEIISGNIESFPRTVGAEDFPRTVGAEDFQPLPSYETNINQYQNVIPRSVGSIVRGFKIGVTKWVRSTMNVTNVWQRNYYERIVRSDKAYRVISNYIVQNPEKWKHDKFYRTNNMIRKNHS